MSKQLKEERNKVSFNLRDLTLYIYRGEERYNKLMIVYKILAEDPIIRNDPSDAGKSRIELFKLAAKKTLRVHELINYSEGAEFLDIWCHSENQLLCFISRAMFIPCIRILGSEEQNQKYLERALKFEIIGAYAQTEMGHGSDVRNLETTATYDPDTDEFVMHTPTLTAMKWWPGELGFTANYCICFAQLIIRNKKYGVQGFIVPIRDIETNKVLPGIEAGDIGHKIGFNTKDNGYLRFTHVRISRDSLLGKYAEVTREGEFKRRGNEKIGYAIMMEVRSSINVACWKAMSMASTIATRYSIVRTQFPDETGKEKPVLDYQLQQDKVITNLALTYAMHAGASKAQEIIQENTQRITTKEDFSMLQDTHATLSATKSFYTWEAFNNLSTLRMACGGHGYASYAGFTHILSEFAPHPTHEGENSVMVLQTARYLIKCLEKIRSGKEVPVIVEYLNILQQVVGGQLKCNLTDVQSVTLDALLEVLRANAAYMVFSAGNTLTESAKKRGMKQAWDQKAGLDLQEAARAHAYYYTFKAFKDKIAEEVKSHDLKNVLEKLCALYAVDKLIKYPQGLFESGFIRPEQFKLLKEKKSMLLEEIRPDAIGLVDAFEYPDNTIRSAIGSYDGDVYENLWKWVHTYNEFNKVDLTETWEKYVKALRYVKRPTPKL